MQPHGYTVTAHLCDIASVCQEFTLVAVYISCHDHYRIRIGRQLLGPFYVLAIIVKNLCPRHFLHQSLERCHCIIRMYLTGTMVADILYIAQHAQDHDLLCFLFIQRKHFSFVFEKDHRFLCRPFCYLYMFVAGKDILTVFLRVFSGLVIVYGT